MDSIRDEIVTCVGGMYPFVGIQIPISLEAPIPVLFMSLHEVATYGRRQMYCLHPTAQAVPSLVAQCL